MCALKWQAKIAGSVLLDEQPAQLATILLRRVTDDKKPIIKKTIKLGEGGSFRFSIWPYGRRKKYTYVITAEHGQADSIESEEFNIPSNRKYELKNVLKLVRKSDAPM